MRKRDEFNASREAGLFDHVIWVDASKRRPPESADSMELVASDADTYLDNNGSEETLDFFVDLLRPRILLAPAHVKIDAILEGCEP